MQKLILKKQPSEIFGNPYLEGTNELKDEIQQQYCPFIKGTCVKPRKSEPHIKVGICSLGYKCDFIDGFEPVIICPQRFKENIMFDTIRKKYLSCWTNIEWISEVNIGVGGSVDYVAITKDKNNKIIDFFCLELQAAGTTGSPYPAIVDIRETGKFQRDSYNFGINWANEFSKTMMQQAYKKGKIVNHWGRKIVFVLQDVGLKYIHSACDTSKLQQNTKEMPVDFCTFKMIWDTNQDKWTLSFDTIVSTDIDVINLMLGGAKVDMYLTEEEFITNIIKKGIADEILNKNDYLEYL
ncbi:MAG: hypothetical protein LBP59_06070 [Planctomycetaceae bacterium]|jgi:hypothetical protein|nr:hypothetical protein [Planctomycetaceae bacterium]